MDCGLEVCVGIGKTYRQSIFERHRSDEDFSEFLPTIWRQKSTGVDMELDYVDVTL